MLSRRRGKDDGGKGLDKPRRYVQSWRSISYFIAGILIYMIGYMSASFFELELSSNSKPLKLVVYLPFIEKEMDKLTELFQTNWHVNYYDKAEKLAICSGKNRKHIDLVLGFNFNAEAPRLVPAMENLLELAQTKVGHCFANIHISSSKLSIEEDIHPGGVSNQIYNMLTRQSHYLLSNQYDYVQVLEADIFPLRSFWLDAIYDVAHDAEPYWVKGAFFAGRDWDEYYTRPEWIREEFLYWGQHINGAALYTLNDIEFVAFIQGVRTAYPPNDVWNPYDVAIMKRWKDVTCMDPNSLLYDATEILSDIEYARRVKCFEYYQLTSTKFRYSNVIQMLGKALDSLVVRNKVLRNPHAYLVHGQLNSASEARSLALRVAYNQDNEQD